ncbi:MAG TPA: peptidoglycan-binding domain-containing protein, partial [Bacteroidia bacterium]|nr:peptidoglycan-binding domain-containing protein [Bacteroidia bacterium]
MEEKITDSVGEGGKNIKADVIVVQKLLINVGYIPALNTDGKTNADGICGNGTKAAIRKFQAEKTGSANPDGRIDPGGKTWKALMAAKKPGIDTTNVTSPKTTPETFAKIKQTFPNGITVAVYLDYDKTGKPAKDNNNAEFPRAAAAYAKFFSAVGIDSLGNIALGLPIAVKNLDQITTALTSIHAVLNKEHVRSGTVSTALPPAFTKIRVLSLFAHGQPYGLNLLGRGVYNLRIDSTTEYTKMRTFIGGIRNTLTPDVHANLFACHAGRETDGTEPQGIWYIEDADKQDGSSSFAAAMAAELGKDSSVYAHLSAGHTVDNYSARVFGKQAGKDATVSRGGVHIFYLLYPETFRDAEALRLGKTREKTRAQMLKHYKAMMDTSSKDKLSVLNPEGKLAPGRLGALMF